MFKIKRYEFGVISVLIALFAASAGISLVSAYGAACLAWQPALLENPPYSIAFGYVATYQTLFQAMNLITWITSFLIASLIFLILVKFKFAWELAVISAILGFIAGIIPAMIADTKGFTQDFAMGSPHWAKTIVNLILMIVVLIPWVRSSLKSYAASESSLTGNIGKQLAIISTIFFWLSIFSFTATGFMADAHIIDGINFWQIIEIQTIGAVLNLIAGISTLSVGLVFFKIRPHTSLVLTEKS